MTWDWVLDLMVKLNLTSFSLCTKLIQQAFLDGWEQKILG